MKQTEKNAALITGIGLFVVAALFSIGILLGFLDYGATTYNDGNILSQLGSMLISVYGFCSILIPAFFFVAGSFCLSAKWSVQRAFILLISIIPFFTLVFAETTCRNISAEDSSPIAFVKIITLMAIAFLLVATEYLFALVIASRIEDKIYGRESTPIGFNVDAKKIKTIFTKTIPGFVKSNIISKFNKTSENEDYDDEDSLVIEENVYEDIKESPAPEEADDDDDEIQWSIDDEGNVPEEFSSKKENPRIPLEEKKSETDEYDESDFDHSKAFSINKNEIVYSQEEENFEEPDFDDDNIIAQFEKNSLNLNNTFEKTKSEPEVDPEYEIEFEDNTEEFSEEPENPESYEYSDEEDLFEFDDEENLDIEEKNTDSEDTDFSDNNKILDQEDIDYSNIESEDDFQDDQNEIVAPTALKDPTLFKTDKAKISSDLENLFSKMDQDARVQVVKNYNNQSHDSTDTENSESVENPEPKKIIPSPHKKRNYGQYKISTDLLTEYAENKYWIIDEETRQASLNLQETLKEFSIQAEITGIRKGPVVTMFEILPAPGVKLSKIVGLADNIALRLAAQSVRIVAPIPGKRAVGIEIPNKDRAIVSFRECIEQQRPEWKKMAVPVVLGKDIQGETQIIDLVKTPHLLIAGSTGAGKSVCVNSMILSILYKRNPNDVKMILIDPKIVELKLYNNIPHLLTPVITEPKKAMQALQYCLCEMERRYAVLDSLGCRDISSYNKKIVDQKICTEKIPYLIVIIDEFADLMATTGKQLEGVVARLCAMSRAVGIHLVLATQRPSVDVITGLIKANIPSRVAFMVAAKMDSRIIIDQVGAEKLLGKGDMLYASSTDPFPVRIQGAFVSDQEVEDVVSAVKEWGEPEYIDDEIFVDDEDSDEDGQMSLFNDGADDPLYDKALDIVIQAGKASASYIQRRLSIGYNRAARLVELMEERGIVGPANGSKPREIIHMP